MIYNFTEKEKGLIKAICEINPEKDLTEDEEIELIEIMENKLFTDGFIIGTNYIANDIGNICEDIIT